MAQKAGEQIIYEILSGLTKDDGTSWFGNRVQPVVLRVGDVDFPSAVYRLAGRTYSVGYEGISKEVESVEVSFKSPKYGDLAKMEDDFIQAIRANNEVKRRLQDIGGPTDFFDEDFDLFSRGISLELAA